jgi:hypothetical protein
MGPEVTRRLKPLDHSVDTHRSLVTPGATLSKGFRSCPEMDGVL